MGFVYITGLAVSHRHTGAFGNGVHCLVETLKAKGVGELRCHAREDDAYTNGIYSRLGPAIGVEKNRRGDTCILYANSVENVLARTDRRRKRSAVPVPELAIAG